MSDDLFIEVFPIDPDSLPSLYAYHVVFSDPAHLIYGGKLAYRLSRTFPGTWVWAGQRLITDAVVSTIQMDIALDVLRNQVPELYGKLESIEEDPRWQLTARAAAEWTLRGPVRALEPDLRQKLAAMSVSLKNVIVERDMHIDPWEVAGHPALSLSIHSLLRYPHVLSEYLGEGHTPEEVIGLQVVDVTSPSMIANLTQYAGPLAEHRERLLSLTRRDVMQTLIRQAPDDEAVFLLHNGDYEYQYVASALYPLISAATTELERFGAPMRQAQAALQLRPDQRAQMIRTLSDVLKQAKLVGSAYSTRTSPYVFGKVEMTPNLLYGNKRVMPYRAASTAHDLVKAGVYRQYELYHKTPMRVTVVRLTDEPVEDFIEVLRRQLDKTFGLRLEMLKERPLTELSPETLKTLGKALDKDRADCVLVFGLEESEDNADLAILHAVIGGRSLPMYPISAATMHDPDAMPRIMMSLLARTGHLPFVLAEPLEYADYVTGLTILRDPIKKKKDRFTALHRIYQSDGTLVGYRVDTCEVGTGESCPLALIQSLFPHDLFQDKRVILHHEGEFEPDVLMALGKWSAALGIALTPVEVQTRNIPRLYCLNGKIEQAPWGSLFKLTDDEAFVMTSYSSATMNAEPLHIRVRAEFPVELAVYSVLAWTLLHYGAPTAKRPVTLQNADHWIDWVRLGRLGEGQGEIPFWL